MSEDESTGYTEILHRVEIVENNNFISVPVRTPKSTTWLEKGRRNELICRYCGKLFANKFVLKRHVAIHTGERAFPCHLCKKSFIQKTDLQRHVATHSDARPFVCAVEDCERAHKTKKNLTGHIFRAHLRYVGTTREGQKKYRCRLCGKMLEHSSLFSKHMKFQCDRSLEPVQENPNLIQHRLPSGQLIRQPKIIVNQSHQLKTKVLYVDLTQERPTPQSSSMHRSVNPQPNHQHRNAIYQQSAKTSYGNFHDRNELKETQSMHQVQEKENTKIAYEFVDEDEFLPDMNDPYELIDYHKQMNTVCKKSDFSDSESDFEVKWEQEEVELEPSSMIEMSDFRFETDWIKEERDE